MLKRVIKRSALVVLTHPLALKFRLQAIASADALTILNLHRVADKDGSAYPPLAPRLFDELLTFLKKHFHLVTFSGLSNAQPANKPRLILSFDDGYKDFVDFAVPILEKHRVRVNQNVIPECIEKGLPPLNVLAQDFIGKAPGELLRALDIPGLSIKELVGNREAIGLRVSSFLKARPMAEQENLLDGLLPQLHRFDKFQPTPMMSRAEIAQLATVHEFGAHSYAHASMALETDEYFRKDLEKCRDYFLNRLHLPASIYAFPNGSCREGQAAEAFSHGFQHVLLVKNTFSHQRNSVHARFGIYGESFSEMQFRSLGGFQSPRANA